MIGQELVAVSVAGWLNKATDVRWQPVLPPNEFE
jgi:hypothetical protein